MLWFIVCIIVLINQANTQEEAYKPHLLISYVD